MRVLLALGVTLTCGCRDKEGAEIRLVLGEAETDRADFRPKSALAEHIDVPSVKHELRITLADFEASCDRFVEPEPGQTSITLSLLSPASSPPAPASYDWSGVAPEGPVGTRVAIPSVRLGRRGLVLPGGGSLRLTRVDLEAGGGVDGVLDFESAASAEQPSTSLRGRLSARLCRAGRR